MKSRGGRVLLLPDTQMPLCRRPPPSPTATLSRLTAVRWCLDPRWKGLRPPSRSAWYVPQTWAPRARYQLAMAAGLTPQNSEAETAQGLCLSLGSSAGCLAGHTRTIQGAALSWRAGWAPLGQRVTLPRSPWHLCEATCRPGLDSGPRGRAPQSPQTRTRGALPGVPHCRLRGHFSSCFQNGSDGGGGGADRRGRPLGLGLLHPIFRGRNRSTSWWVSFSCL